LGKAEGKRQKERAVGHATHLGIQLADYDAAIVTFIPRYGEMLDAAVEALTVVAPRAPQVVDLGTGTGALAARVLKARPRATMTGIDEDEGMLGLATRRLRGRLTAIVGDIRRTPIPTCDAITASFALHHIRTPREKAAVYRRCAAALRPGGMLVNADCCLSADPQRQRHDRAAWSRHLQQSYSRARAEGYLRAWAKEDFYFTLDAEVAMMRQAGFTVDIPWRRDSFAVIVGRRAVR